MIYFLRRNLCCLILKHRSPVSVHFFSTFTATQLGSSPALFDILRYKYDFSSELASRVTSAIRLKNPEKADAVLSFFKDSGFSNTELERTVKYRPRILTYSLEDSIKPKFKFFRELGFSSNDISGLISRTPGILGLSLNSNILPSLSVLKGLLGSDNEIIKVLKRAPWFLPMNFGNTVLPNVEFLKSCGICMNRIRIIFIAYPNCFLIRPEVMRKCVEKAEEIGLAASSKNFLYAIPTLASRSSEAWENKLQAFRDLGFSDSDISTMFKKRPLCFLASMEKIKKIKELLLATGKFNMSSIVNFPLSLDSSIEKRFEPRLQILRVLESRELIKEWPSLSTICLLTDDKFCKKFICPYLNEIGDVDIIKNFSRGKKEMKP